MNWKPIETAPKDGTWVLLAGGICAYDEGDNDARPTVAQWTKELNNHTDEDFSRWQFAWYDGGYYGEYLEPTHWMELPAFVRAK